MSSSDSPFFEAVQSGEVDKVRKYLSNGSVNCTDENGMTALHWACVQGCLEVARVLLAEVKCDHSIQDMFGRSPLHCASENGHVEVIRVLVSEYEADYTIWDCNGHTPLHSACENGHLEAAKVFMTEVDADKTIENNMNGSTPLHIACKGGYLEIVKAFLSEFHTIKDYDGCIPLHYACQEGHLEVVVALLSEIKTDRAIQNVHGSTPLHFACENGHLEIVKVLISKFAASHTMKDSKGRTPLHSACKSGNLDIVRLLAEVSKADNLINMKDNFGRTPLFYAFRKGFVSIVGELVLKFKADITDIIGDSTRNNKDCLGFTRLIYRPCILDANKEDCYGRTLLHHACILDATKLAQILIREHEFSLDAELLHLAFDHSHINFALSLINEFAFDPNVVEFGQTLLHRACQNGYTIIAHSLIRLYKADLNICNVEKKMPYQLAIQCNHFELALSLISEFGLNPDSLVDQYTQETLLHIACKRGDINLLRALICDHHANIDALNSHNETAVVVAASNGKFEAVLLLCILGCATNVVDRFGQTLLHLACKMGATEVAHILTHHYKADLNVPSYAGKTPHMLAIENLHFELALSLITKFGCSSYSADYNGQTLLHLACREGATDIARALLSQSSAKLNVFDDNHDTPLFVAVNSGKFDLVLSVSNEFSFDPHLVDSLGQTLLHLACRMGAAKLAQALIRHHKADINACNIERKTPYHLAIECHHSSLVVSLIGEFGCDSEMEDEYGQTLLHLACKEGDVDLVRTLVIDHSADMNVISCHNETPIFVAASCGKVDVVLLLICEFGCDPNAANHRGETLLHIACKYGDVSLVRALCDHKADVNCSSDVVKTPLHVAVESNHSEVAVSLICEFDCDFDILVEGNPLLYYACKRGLVDIVRALISHNAQWDDDRNPLLHVAVINGQLEVTSLLLEEFSFDPNVCGFTTRTPIHIASLIGHHDIVLQLLKFSSPFLTDDFGNTPLHFASRSNNVECVKSLVHAKAPLLYRNKRGETPIDVAILESKEFLSFYRDENTIEIASSYDEALKLARRRYSGSNYVTRVFVLGYPGAGKSTFIESLKREKFLKSIRKVTVPPHTAGIIPSVFVSEKFGRVMFYDFAGDAEYYSSHAAIFESLALSRKGSNLFIIVVDLRKDDATIKATLYYWFSFIQYQKYMKPLLVVVGSHYDLSDNKRKKAKLLETFCSSVVDDVAKVMHFLLDCRDSRSNRINSFRKVIANWIQDSPQYEISFEASILLGLLEKDFREVTACPVQTLVSHVKDSGVWLPESLYDVILELHEVGVVLLLGGSTDDSSGGQVVLNISQLTNEVHELLFSQSAFSKLQETQEIDSFNIGVLPEKVLLQILPQYITKECLIHLQYCQQIDKSCLCMFPSLTKIACESLLFFPALCTADKSQVSWDISSGSNFSIGWLALCNTDPKADSRDYYPPRFLHVLLLRLVYGFTHSVPQELQTGHFSSEYSRRCTMWKKGVQWSTVEGVDCMVELVNESKGVVVLSKSTSDWAEKCIDVFTSVVNCVLQAKVEFCNSINPQFFFLDSVNEADYLNKEHHFLVSEVEKDLAEGNPFSLSVGHGNGKLNLHQLECLRRHTQWNSIFPIEYEQVLQELRFIVKESVDLALVLGAPSEIIDTFRALPKESVLDFNRRREEVVKWWMMSSLNPPCWWALVEALKDIEKGEWAEDMRQKHSLHVQLQEKILDKRNQFQKPDEKFLRLLSGVVKSKWSSIAVTLSLSDNDIKELNENVRLHPREIAFQMLKIWALKEEATYGHLCCRLNTISIFQHSN